ncbi:MAG TPA: YCF48-related protein [Candidatus Sulfotelmatobacter sp.]
MSELPNIVRERLKASRPASAHPDAEVLTAFVERSLPEFERALVTEHLARCHDCRDILALSLPAPVVVETVRVPFPGHRGWLRAPVLRWGVVAAGFAVLAVTGLLQYQGRHRPQSYIAARQESAAIPASTSAVARVDSGKPMPGTPKVAPGSGADFGSAASATPSRVDTGPAGASNTVAALNDRSAAASVNEPSALSPAVGLSTSRLSTSLASGSAGRAADGAIVGGDFKQSPPNSQPTAPPSSTTVAVSAAAPALASTTDQAVARPLQYEAKAQQKDELHGNAGQQRSFFDAPVDKAKAPAAGQAVGRPLPSPLALAPRWAISTTGGLLRSFDQGRSWAIVDVSMSASMSAGAMMEVANQNQQNQQIGQNMRQVQAQSQASQSQATQAQATQTQATQTQDQSLSLNKSQAENRKKVSAPVTTIPVFRALSAAGSEVWAGGTSGLLYHSADNGQRWVRVFLMTSGVPSTGDIIDISFPDPQHGQITTSTQERWVTLDAGQTWQKQ